MAGPRRTVLDLSGLTQRADGATRFLNGTPNIPARCAAKWGYEIFNQVGVENIRAKSQRQTQHLIDLADEAGIPVRTCREAGRRGGVVILDVPNGKAVTQELARRESLVDYARKQPSASHHIAIQPTKMCRTQ